MKVNWCASCGAGRNFGDQLTPVLLTHFGIAFRWTRPPDAELVCVGSILSKIPNGWRGTVLGTGFILPTMRRDLSRARVLAVRGELTRKQAGLPVGTPLGDPGILVGDLLTESGPPTGILAIPHYVDRRLVKRHPEARPVSIQTPVLDLVRLISGASLVYTSSLHALIAADALGVPCVLELSQTIGGLFKFRDYGSALGVTIRPGRERLTDRRVMAERQAELRSLFALLTNWKVAA